MDSIIGPQSKVVIKSKARATELYGSRESQASRQTQLDYCVGYIDCKKEINEKLSNPALVGKMHDLVVGQVVTDSGIIKILKGILNELEIGR